MYLLETQKVDFRFLNLNFRFTSAVKNDSIAAIPWFIDDIIRSIWSSDNIAHILNYDAVMLVWSGPVRNYTICNHYTITTI